MKNMTTKFLLVSAGLTAAVCAQAQQRVVVPAGQDYTIGNIISASGSNVTYQWFRDGVAIANATGASYTVPAILAKHENGLSANYTVGSRFQRAAYGLDCSGGVAMSNEVTVYFCELMVNGVCWARAATNQYGSFNSNPWDLGDFYQWNRPNVGYSPDSGLAISGWNSTPDPAATWTNGYPCPDGWRLPTLQDFQNLHATSQPVGGVWINNQARGIPANVSGRLYGYNTAHCTMSNMVGCIFLPACGVRQPQSGSLSFRMQRGYYASGTQINSANGYSLRFWNTESDPFNNNNKAFAYSIRCVQDVQ